MRTYAARPLARPQSAPAVSTPIPVPSPRAESPASIHRQGAEAATSPFGHHFSQVGVHPAPPVNAPGDRYEREAERVAGEVSEAAPAGRGPRISAIPPGDAGAGGSARQVDASFAERLAPGTAGGSPLPGPARAFFEPRFGHDFGGVRVHRDAEAARLNGSLGARAFAYGRALYFGAGQYQPASPAGRRLLAHELTHVVQQRNGALRIQMAPDQPAGGNPYEPIQTLKDQLIATYHFAEVLDGDKKWTESELQQVVAALALLPPEDKAALGGVVLKRDVSLGPRVGGRFRQEQSLTETNLVNDFTLNLTDLTFKDGPLSSRHAIIHEVGHAVASLKYRNAKHDLNWAKCESNEAVLSQRQVVIDLKAAKAACALLAEKGPSEALEAAQAKQKALVQAYGADEVKWTAAQGEKARQQKAFDQTGISADALKKIKDDAADYRDFHDAALSAARKALRTFPLAAVDEAASYRSAVAEASRWITGFADATASQSLDVETVDDIIEVVEALIKTRDSERDSLAAKNKANPVLAGFAPVHPMQDQWFKAARAHALAKDRLATEQRFAEFVTAEKIEPFTDYARETWPQKPGEFYAEAYSWFVNRSADLKAKSMALYDWFAAGKHR